MGTFPEQLVKGSWRRQERKMEVNRETKEKESRKMIREEEEEEEKEENETEIV